MTISSYVVLIEEGNNQPSKQTIIYPLPAHYRAADEWQDIDMSLVREDDGYMIKASSLSARFKDKADSTDMISITDGKHSVSWGVESDDAPEAKIIENKPDNDMIRAPLSWITSDIGYEGLDVITYDEISTLVSIRDITSDSDTVWHVLTNIRGDIESIYDHNDGFHTRYSYH